MSHLRTDKVPPKWAWSGPMVEFLNFKTPLPKFGTGEARNFKFRTLIGLGKYHLEHDEIPLKRAWSESSDQKLEF